MPSRGLLDPTLLESFKMDGFWPALCTIQENTGTTQDTDGARIEDWDDLEGHKNIPCAARPGPGREIRREDSTIVAIELRVGLQGNYPAITTKHRAVLASGTYNILHVERDSRDLVTYLDLEVVK